MPYSFPSNIAQPGTEYFTLADSLHYKDPIVEEWNVTLERDLGKGVGLRASYDGNHGYNIPTNVNTNQVPENSAGFSAASTQAAIPFPLLAYIATSTNQGFANYQAGTFSVKKRAASLQFEVSYTYTRNLANVNGAPVASAANFVNEFGDTLSDPYRPGLDYGNVPFSRRNRVLATFLYELPFGKGKTFLNSNSILDKVVGGWQLAGLTLFQSGPFMSVAVLSDPSGTGYNIFGALTGNGGRADTVPGVSPYAGQSINQWINPNAFADPCTNACQKLPSGVTTAIGRFGGLWVRLYRRARHGGRFPVVDQALLHQGAYSDRDWDASRECLQPCQLCSSRQSDIGGSGVRTDHSYAERGGRGAATDPVDWAPDVLDCHLCLDFGSRSCCSGSRAFLQLKPRTPASSAALAEVKFASPMTT